MDDSAKAANRLERSAERVGGWRRRADYQPASAPRGGVSLPRRFLLLSEASFGFRASAQFPSFARCHETGDSSGTGTAKSQRSSQARAGFRDCIDDLGEVVRQFKLKAALGDAPETVGEEVRKFLNVNEEDQRQAARDNRSFDFWRRKLEGRGHFGFCCQRAALTEWNSRRCGASLSRAAKSPTIVINGRDYSQGPKCYTLLHELAPCQCSVKVP